ALQAHDDGNIDGADGFVRVDHALRNPVATNDAAKDVDQDRFYFRIFQDDAETGFYRLRVGGAAYVQEVSGFAAGKLDHVHGGHGQARAVHHAAYVAVQLHEVQVVLACFHFGGIFFGHVAQRYQVGMTEQRVIVEAQLAVHGDHLVVRR